MTGRALPPPDDDRTSRGVLVPVLADDVHECTGGWLPVVGAGGPRPCPVCKPHLRWVVDSRTGRGRWELDRMRLPAPGRGRNRRTG